MEKEELAIQRLKYIRDENYMTDGQMEALTMGIEALEERENTPKSVDFETSKLLRLEEPYSLKLTLEWLVKSSNLLLHKFSYDGHDYEEIEGAVKAASEVINLLNIPFKLEEREKPKEGISAEDIKPPEFFLKRGTGNFIHCTDYEDAIQAAHEYHNQFPSVKQCGCMTHCNCSVKI